MIASSSMPNSDLNSKHQPLIMLIFLILTFWSCIYAFEFLLNCFYIGPSFQQHIKFPSIYFHILIYSVLIISLAVTSIFFCLGHESVRKYMLFLLVLLILVMFSEAYHTHDIECLSGFVSKYNLYSWLNIYFIYLAYAILKKHVARNFRFKTKDNNIQTNGLDKSRKGLILLLVISLLSYEIISRIEYIDSPNARTPQEIGDYYCGFLERKEGYYARNLQPPAMRTGPHGLMLDMISSNSSYETMRQQRNDTKTSLDIQDTYIHPECHVIGIDRISEHQAVLQVEVIYKTMKKHKFNELITKFRGYWYVANWDEVLFRFQTTRFNEPSYAVMILISFIAIKI